MTNKTKIELKGLKFYGYHGVSKEEAALGQRFILDVTLTLIDGLDFGSDVTDATVDYVGVYHTVEKVFTGSRFNLIERCAEAVAEAVMARFEKVVQATVKVKKPSVPVDCVCDYFSAEVIRCR